MTRIGADPNVKAFWRFLRKWVCNNHKIYYTYVLFSGMFVYNVWYHITISYYRQRNSHVSSPPFLLA